MRGYLPFGLVVLYLIGSSTATTAADLEVLQPTDSRSQLVLESGPGKARIEGRGIPSQRLPLRADERLMGDLGDVGRQQRVPVPGHALVQSGARSGHPFDPPGGDGVEAEVARDGGLDGRVGDHVGDGPRSVEAGETVDACGIDDERCAS